MAIHFEWDEEKAAHNVRKHAISFAEVTSLFTSGVDYLEIFDTDLIPTRRNGLFASARSHEVSFWWSLWTLTRT